MNRSISEYCIAPNASLMECIRIIDRAGIGIVLAVDDDFRLIGTISDGDIRKALLNGSPLHSSITRHINRKCFYVSPTVPRAEVLDVMQAGRFEQIPIVNEQKKVTGLHLLHDMLGNVPRTNWAIVMAGGEGKRLRPLTEKIPKPMIQVAGRPILERTVLHLVSYGIRRIFFSVNYLAHVIEDYFGDGSEYGVQIEYLHEQQPLGSGGAVSLLPAIPEDPLLIMNGDLIVDANLADLINFHDEYNFFATMGVHGYYHQVPYGCVEMVDNRLVGLEEKPILEKLVNAGIYVLSKEAVSKIPRNTFYPMTALFEAALRKKWVCGTFPIEKDWVDIGSAKELLRARGEF